MYSKLKDIGWEIASYSSLDSNIIYIEQYIFLSSFIFKLIFVLLLPVQKHF